MMKRRQFLAASAAAPAAMLSPLIVDAGTTTTFPASGKYDDFYPGFPMRPRREVPHPTVFDRLEALERQRDFDQATLELMARTIKTLTEQKETLRQRLHMLENIVQVFQDDKFDPFAPVNRSRNYDRWADYKHQRDALRKYEVKYVPNGHGGLSHPRQPYCKCGSRAHPGSCPRCDFCKKCQSHNRFCRCTS